MSSRLKSLLFAFSAVALGVVAALGIGLGTNPLQAQVPSLPNSPYNIELGAVITNSARAPATVTTAKLDNIAYNGVECTFNQSASSGSSSTTFSIQMYDSASLTYQSLVTSGAVTTDATPTTIVVYPGVQTSSLPTGMVALNMKLPRYWRVSQTNAGANTTTTGTVGCNLLR